MRYTYIFAFIIVLLKKKIKRYVTHHGGGGVHRFVTVCYMWEGGGPKVA